MKVSSAADPPARLAGHFRARARLASLESDFRCDPECTRPGCKHPDLQVPVSLVDLLGVAMHLGEPVSAALRRYVTLGLLTDGRDDWIRIVALKLQKPCEFLADDLCAVYPVRPLACILFPEYLAAEGTLTAHAASEHFREYLCLRRPLTLSPARAEVMARLKQMWERERLVSAFYLFDQGACYLDFANLVQELLEEADVGEEPAPTPPPDAPRLIPHRVLERYFRERLAGLPPFSAVNDKISHLDTPEGQAQLWGMLQDERLVKKLRQGHRDRAVVHRLVKGKMKAGRRSLSPTGYGHGG
ncbi:MAG: hypothetical protein FJ128_03325 [Deltaproteobacteria bacterium]|nr:hypothetical protein [Deltaproteobacteria bacterium]